MDRIRKASNVQGNILNILTIEQLHNVQLVDKQTPCEIPKRLSHENREKYGMEICFDQGSIRLEPEVCYTLVAIDKNWQLPISETGEQTELLQHQQT